ncbi:hypothetical protein Tco_1095320 [Tanacetum coccineum]
MGNRYSRSFPGRTRYGQVFDSCRGLFHEMDRSESRVKDHRKSEEKRERAAICEAKSKMKMAKYYNARVRGIAFRPGDFVYRNNDASHTAAGGKLGPKWDGPYEVMEALGDGAYKLRTMDGTDLPRTWNIANLKKCYL